MKRWFKMLTGSLAVVLSLPFPVRHSRRPRSNSAPHGLTSTKPSSSGMPKKKGGTKEGLDIEMLPLLVRHGAAQRPSRREWVLAGTGAVPGMMGALRYGTYTIAVTNDESYTNASCSPRQPYPQDQGLQQRLPGSVRTSGRRARQDVPHHHHVLPTSP